jgi:hypothetical protein
MFRIVMLGNNVYGFGHVERYAVSGIIGAADEQNPGIRQIKNRWILGADKVKYKMAPGDYIYCLEQGMCLHQTPLGIMVEFGS